MACKRASKMELVPLLGRHLRRNRRKAALEDEQAGEDEGQGWRRWKERARRWNLRCPTQKRGGRDDDEEDQEEGKRGVRARGENS